MRIGIFVFYPFRPHTSHLIYIKRNLEILGHVVFEYRCNGMLDSCFYRIEKSKSPLACMACSHTINRSKFNQNDLKYSKDWMAKGVLATLKRIEYWSTDTDEKYEELLSQLNKDLAYTDAKFSNWLVNNSIDYVIGFNGRMDHTAVAFNRCKELSIPFASFESLWFGNGLQILPNADCLSLDYWHRMNRYFSDRPLTKTQLNKVWPYVKKKLKSGFDGEWRQFDFEINKKIDAEVLVLPSSRSEFLGHPDYISEWGHSTEGFSSFIAEMGINPSKVVVKAHPIWLQAVRGIEQDSAFELYKKWCQEKGYYFDYDAGVDPKYLASQVKFILVNGSSAAIELGLHGYKIVCVERSKYSFSGVCVDYLNNRQEIKFREKKEVFKSTVRFMYGVMFRLGSLEGDVRFKGDITSFSYRNNLEYFEKLLGADDCFFNDETYGTVDVEDETLKNLSQGFEERASAIEGFYSINTVKTLIRSLWRKGDQV